MISSAAIMAPIIPPSVIIVVYGAVTHQSIKALFAGALIPGVLIGLGQVLLVAIMARRRNFPKIEMRITPRIFAVSLKDAALALLMPVVILGGILGGIVTPTEAAAISINYALVVEFAIYRNLKIADLYPMLAHTLRMTGMVLFLIAMASILSRVLSKMNVPSFLAERLISNIGNKYLILIIVNFFALRRSLDGNERGGHPPGAHAAGDHDPGGRSSHSLRDHHGGESGNRDGHPSSRDLPFRRICPIRGQI